MCYLWNQNSIHGFNFLYILNAQHDADGNTAKQRAGLMSELLVPPFQAGGSSPRSPLIHSLELG